MRWWLPEAGSTFAGPIDTMFLVILIITGIALVIVEVGVVTFVLLKVIGVLIPLRASAPDESVGLDVSMHGEEAYVHGGGTARS